MEDAEWKRDKTPYIVFACLKCRQYMYAKHTQKTKKCLRCGRIHRVSNILNSGVIVNGMTSAVEKVKEQQHELAIQEIASAPEFRSYGDFKIQKVKKPKNDERLVLNEESNYIKKFNKMLMSMGEIYTKVPYYVFEIFAENYNIPGSELNFLIHIFQREGVLIREGIYYIIKLH